jgi:hypothetical protein
MVQAIFSGGMALVVARTWWRQTNRSLRAATLLSATLLAVPLALLYDKLLLLVAIGWLVRDARRDGFLPWEKTGLLVVWLGSMAEYAIGSAWSLPLGPVISSAILLLTLRRTERVMVVKPSAATAGQLEGLPASAP